MQINSKIHFIGISGIGMSGIAELMLDKGYSIQGSDISVNDNTKRLKKKGIKFFLGHNKKNIKNAHAIVYSSAIKKNNPEIREAYIKKIPVLSRADMLSELMKNKKSIAIAGSHGKTTTTSLVGNIFNEAGLDPTIVNGGIINSFSNNNRYGKGEWMIVEADESDGTFLKLPHQISIITNLDIEHMDFYKSKKNLINAFEKFINLLPFYGTTIMCYDDKNLKLLINKIKTRNILTYSIKNKKADVLIFDIIQNKLKTSFKLKINNKIIHSSNYKFTINAIGNHNILNATASIIAAKLNGIKNKDIDVLQKIIIQCCEIKSDIVSEDENENELRMILNFGHTVGHAIESFTNYKNLLHGEAIFYGMKCALYLSNKFGNLSNDEYDISTQLLSKFELPKLDIDNRETFINFVKNDKKFREKKIRFILLDEIGKSRISKDITFDQIKESLSVL